MKVITAILLLLGALEAECALAQKPSSDQAAIDSAEEVDSIAELSELLIQRIDEQVIKNADEVLETDEVVGFFRERKEARKAFHAILNSMIGHYLSVLVQAHNGDESIHEDSQYRLSATRAALLTMTGHDVDEDGAPTLPRGTTIYEVTKMVMEERTRTIEVIQNGVKTIKTQAYQVAVPRTDYSLSRYTSYDPNAPDDEFGFAAKPFSLILVSSVPSQAKVRLRKRGDTEFQSAGETDSEFWLAPHDYEFEFIYGKDKKIQDVSVDDSIVKVNVQF